MSTTIKKKKATDSETPLMKQYNSIKAKYPDALLLFRVGDFYETFDSDAVTASRILGIVLTKRSNGAAAATDLAGFPHHALDTYLPKLVRAGQRVAICDQLEDPKTTKTIVKRGVTELVTPGVAISEKILDHKSNNFLAVINSNATATGIALVDLSTGEFYCAQGNAAYTDKIISSFNPSEIVMSKSNRSSFVEKHGDKYYTYPIDDWVFSGDFSKQKLLDHFETTTLKGFGIDELDLAITAAGCAIYYLNQTQQDKLGHINAISRLDENEFVWLDKFTIRNLELVDSVHESATTLKHVLDKTLSPMGSRLLNKWILMPLKDLHQLNRRLDVVDAFYMERELAAGMAKLIMQVGDLERIISRVAVKKVTPRELNQLCRSLEAIPQIIQLLQDQNCKALQILGSAMHPCNELTSILRSTLNDEAPVNITKGNAIRNGVSAELDSLRKIAFSGKDYLLQIQMREIENTGISSLKIGFNNVFGYYIEVTNAHKSKVPEGWIRKQTLVNAERYITQELKEYEEKILGAEEKIQLLEEQLFQNLVDTIANYITPVQSNGFLIAQTDCMLAFANIAYSYNYTRPVINDGNAIDIKAGRHPVLERQMPPGEQYITNDVFLDNENQQLIILTGPNMSGKSALLRQTALITLMAQIGSFVPADSASIGIVDKIFTRVGASDNISSGESTFMVEMNETASILNNLTPKSLLILDEIGRGTSTYDGISIAWAIAEFLHEQPQARAKTLFATHYHELNEIAAKFPRIKNYHIEVRETGKNILFMRKLVPGGSEHSFGIHVAKMAGMPQQVLKRANEMLLLLEKAHSNAGLSDTIKKSGVMSENMQLSFISLDDPLLEQIRDQILNTDIDRLTPVEALMRLHDIKKLLSQKK